MNKRIYRITVHGRVYEVEVEEISATSIGAQAPQITSAPSVSAPSTPSPSISPAPPKKLETAPAPMRA